MARLTPEQQLQRAKQVKAKAEADIKSASAKLRAADRRMDTRRKILVGAAFMSKAAQRDNFANALRSLIAEMPERDRALFKDWPNSAG